MGEVIKRVSQEQKDIVNGIQLQPLDIDDYEDYATAEALSQTPIKTEPTVDFDLKKGVDLSVAKDIKQNLKHEQERQKAEENMKTWRIQLDSVESETEKVMIAQSFELKTLIEALRRNVEKVDNTYLMFVKKEDRKPMHMETLDKLAEDMVNEYNEIVPYVHEAEDFKSNMM